MLLWALRKKPGDRLKTSTELLSSLILAAGASVDEVPPRADVQSAPVTASILDNWEYLPPAKPGILEGDRPPLRERLAQAFVTQPKGKKLRLRILPVVGFFLFAGLISLFWFIKPAPPPAIPTPVYLTPFIASNFTPPPTITPTPRPTHVPGNRIAFTCTRGDFNQICLINVDGTGFTQLSDIEASNYYPVFAPQGGSLLFSSNRNGAFDLYILSFDERDLFQITHNIGNVVSPDFSPDGTKIVFVNQSDVVPSSIWIVNADGLNPHLVYQGLNTIVSTAWSPDGETIAYAMSRGIPNEYEIFLMDRDGKNNRQISQGMLGIGGSIAWSPDGRYLLVYAGPYADKDIFRIDMIDGEVTQLTHGGNNAAASYSPDGRYIAFNSLRNNDQADIYIMNADGTGERQLTDHPEPDWGPVWEP
jgi:TolB protein